MPRRVLIIGGSFAGLCCARDLSEHFYVTIIDAKEFFEYTPGILRAYVKPKHFDALSFCLHPAIEGPMGARYIWGEVIKLDGPAKTATFVPMFTQKPETIDFDYCICASGCNFNPTSPFGESLWFPVVHRYFPKEQLATKNFPGMTGPTDMERANASEAAFEAMKVSEWKQFDERFLEGRRRHILSEYNSIKKLWEKKAKILVVGAGFIGVEWVTELEHFFPGLQITIIDFLHQCLGPLPANAAAYCARYMKKKGIQFFAETGYAPDNKDFWEKIGYTNGQRPDKTYITVGVKASNYFMPMETLSKTGPGGGKWILIDKHLAVIDENNEVWCKDAEGFPRIFAVGDCNNGCVPEEGNPNSWKVPPIPKISYPGEEEAVITTNSILKIDAAQYGDKKTVTCLGNPIKILNELHWPWGAGMFATSLGPDDACFVLGANWEKGSGLLCFWKGQLSAVQKEIIEASKINECRYGLTGRLIWHFVHHTPFHFWGRGPFVGYWPWQ
jgi:NADH dehydrogenase FAD-containing subunit